MKVSVKGDYAARAVMALARHHTAGTAQKVESLAAEQNIPANYLAQILIELKARGIVRSLRGKVGGYLLARPPSEITLGEVLRSIYGEIFESPASADGQCPPELRAAWLDLQRTMNEKADSITFQNLLDQSQEKNKMYYI